MCVSSAAIVEDAADAAIASSLLFEMIQRYLNGSEWFSPKHAQQRPDTIAMHAPHCDRGSHDSEIANGFMIVIVMTDGQSVPSASDNTTIITY